MALSYRVNVTREVWRPAVSTGPTLTGLFAAKAVDSEYRNSSTPFDALELL
jgi:hypothetical protein